MKDRKLIHWQVVLAIALLLPSALIYYLQIHLFGNPRDTLFYLLQDLAFVPIQVLIVTVLINQLLAVREKRNQLKRLNMIIGVYFSETGNDLIHLLIAFDERLELLREKMLVDLHWEKREFQLTRKMIVEYEPKVDSRRGNLSELKEFLVVRRPFLLSLLENSSLLEHQSFTDALWAIFHLTDELAARDLLDELPEKDFQHLGVDIQRTYRPILLQWIQYMEHLQGEYPFLFSLAVRKNPFRTTQSVIFE